MFVAYAVTYAAALLVGGFALAGAGHGWGGALIASLAFAYSLVAAANVMKKRAAEGEQSWRRVWVAVLVGDAFVGSSLVSEFHDFQRVQAGAMVWLALALAPQVLLAGRTVAGRCCSHEV